MTVTEYWKTFALAAIPKDAPLTQLQQMKMAFYVGAWSMACKSTRITESDESEEIKQVELQTFIQECAQFIRSNANHPTVRAAFDMAYPRDGDSSIIHS